MPKNHLKFRNVSRMTRFPLCWAQAPTPAVTLLNLLYAVDIVIILQKKIGQKWSYSTFFVALEVV